LNYSINHIAKIINADGVVSKDDTIEQLLLDSRKVYSPATAIFFAIKGIRRDGHLFIPELYKRGVRNLVTSKTI